MSETFICSICGCETPLDERHIFDGRQLCDDCFEDVTVICDCCENRVWRSDTVSDSHTIVCDSCYDRHYTTCTECGRILYYDAACYPDEDDEDAPYCRSCAAQFASRSHPIQNYGYKPVPIFYGNGKRFLGVELEIDRGGEYDDHASRLIDLANGSEERIYCKHDGSINCGFEIVTHPMTLEYHETVMPWSELLRSAINMGYRSHQTSTCGLHVHVNRDSLGDTPAQQEDTIARILFFVENNWNELLKFSRRTVSKMQQWAARYGRKDSPKEVMETAKNKCYSRYSCVNLLNYSTIEFRMFRGTLRCSTLKATLQLVNEICDVAFSSSDEEMSDLTWVEFVARLDTKRCPELVNYLKERRLYVCAPVQGEEEL